MTTTAFCITALTLSVFILLSSIVIGIVLHRLALSRGNTDGRKKFIFTPFHVFLIGFLIALVILLYPIYYVDFLSGDHGFVKVVKSILLSIQNALCLFTLNGNFENVRAFFIDSSVSSVVSSIYTVYAAMMFVAAPALTARLVLSFFKGFSAFIRYMLYPRSDIYLMSELNEQSIFLAQDILSHKTKKRRTLVVFTNVFENDEEKNFELITRAKELGAICMRKDLTEVSLKLSRRIVRKIYLIGINEDANTQQALAMIEKCRHSDRYNSKNTEIYVFSNSVESVALLDSIDNGEIKVRRINENRSLIIDTLKSGVIFDDAQLVGDTKEISVAIVGLGAYGVELLKAICWCGQLPGYNITIHAFDIDADCYSKIMGVAPELMEYNGMDFKGEPHYKIVFHDNVNVKSYAFQEEIAKIELVTSAFVTLGDDELNIETAMKMRTQFGREYLTKGKNIPSIYAVVYNDAKTKAVEHGLKNMLDEDYGITFIGSIRSRYSLEIIEQNELEADGLSCHLHWISHVEEAKAIERFHKYEYYRRSSIAEAIYLRFREKLVKGTDPEILKEYEHKRWSAYMRSEGYIGLGCKKDYIAKTHPSLIPYQSLSQEEKDKDDINLNPQKDGRQ